MQSPAFRQIVEDILILNGLGLYYANLFRAALFYSIYEKTGDPAATTQSLAAYRKARDAWAVLAERADKIYTNDISYGDIAVRRGHWADRLPAIDNDVAAVEKYFAEQPVRQTSAAKAIQRATKASPRPIVAVDHAAPAVFTPGSDLPLTSCNESTRHRVNLVVSPCESGRALALYADGEDRQCSQCFHSRELHELAVPFAVLLRDPHGGGGYSASGIQCDVEQPTLLRRNVGSIVETRYRRFKRVR